MYLLLLLFTSFCLYNFYSFFILSFYLAKGSFSSVIKIAILLMTKSALSLTFNCYCGFFCQAGASLILSLSLSFAGGAACALSLSARRARTPTQVICLRFGLRTPIVPFFSFLLERLFAVLTSSMPSAAQCRARNREQLTALSRDDL